MADQSNETLRQMLSGFSAMQYNLGLLPMQQSQAMAGAAAPFQAPPPPPQVPHPAEAALAAMQTHQNMVQQTLQAAQMTRYQPPPSAPMPSMQPMAAYSPAGYGGGGGGGGGFSFGGAFGAAASAAASFVGPIGGGGHGGGGGGMPFAPRLPSIFNPFAVTVPQAHFASPAMRNLQMMQHSQSQMMGMISGAGDALFRMGGNIAGNAIAGPIGGWVGEKLGGAISGMTFGPTNQDFARGRQVQQMTSPFMVTGPFMNTATGQGMDSRAGREVATGIRHMQRDYDFERTGFNTADTMRIMQMSGSQGLLTGAQSPDQLVQKVKDISKTVKVLMKITGDPDVRDAIQSLGQMREMGFMGLASQAGAVANRASFARMAGVSQAQMTQTMMMGADIASQYGLVGATGANAAMFGAGAANVAASSGALNELQLARAGGRGGLGQINTQASLAAMQNEYYLLAGSRIGKGGKLEMDMDAFRQAQTKPFDVVAKEAAEKLREMNTHGIFDWNTRKQELKDQIAQQLKPGEMQQMVFQQARAFMQKVPGMTLGTAIQQTTGLDANQARALEVQFQSRQYWQGLADQNRVQRRELAEQEAAHREQYRTPGLGTRMRRGLNDAWDTAVEVGLPMRAGYRALSEHLDRVHEDNAAADAGERISRYDESQVARDDAERNLLRQSLHKGGLRRAYAQGGPGIGDRDPSAAGQIFSGALGMVSRPWARSTGRQINRIGSTLGLGSLSDENKLAAIADYSRGRYTSVGETFGDADDALARVQDVMGAAQGANLDMTGKQLGSLHRRISDASGGGRQINSAAVLSETTANVVDGMKSGKAGYIKSARAMSASDVKEAYMTAATKHMSPAEAERSWEANKTQIISNVSKDIYAGGDKKLIEQWEKAKEVQSRAGAVDLARSRDAAEDQIKEELKDSGMGDLGDKTMSEVKSIIAHNDDDTIALATAIKAQTSGNDEEKERGRQVQAQLREKLGAEKYGELERKAQGLAGSMSDDVGDAFERTLRDTHGLAGVQMNIQRARTAAGHKMEMAARNEFTQKLASRVGRKDLAAMTPEEAARSLHDDELDKLDDETKKAVLAAREGNTDQLDEMIARAGPSNRTSRHSDAASKALTELDDQYDKLTKLAADAEDKDGKGDLQSQSITVFADSVKVFADAVKDLKGTSELDRLNALNPINQSQG